MRAALLLASLLMATTVATQGAAADAQGAKVYQRCAACHLPNGEGVPGAFPALAGRVELAAATNAGRDYLVMTIVAGVIGEIDVDGRKMRGVMPAQAGLSDADVAAVLNHTMNLKGAAPAAVAPRAFTAEEVAAIKVRFGKTSPAAVHAIRSGAFSAPAAPPK